MTGSAAKDRLVYPLQTRVVNPVVMLAHDLGIPPPGDALLETTGRLIGRGVWRRLCFCASAAAATDPLTVRIDLETG